MLDFERETDIDVLRQLARLQDRELRRTRRKLYAALREVARLQCQDEGELQRELLRLQEMVAEQQHALFGPSSEKRKRPSTPRSTPRPPRRGHSHKPQPRLPVVPEIHDLDEADKQCPKCGGGLREMKGQFEESEEIDVVEVRYVCKKHQRKKYRCACNGHIETADGPTKLIPGGRYSLPFAIHVAVNKYLYHLPLERQVEMMADKGLDVDSQTLWDQIFALASLLMMLSQRQQAYLMTKLVLCADETPWRLLVSKNAGVRRTWYVWSACADDAVFYTIQDTRSHQGAKKLLGDFAGTVVTDGFKAYDKYRRNGGRYAQAHCWAHVRRKMVAAERYFPREAGAIINLIDELFLIERLGSTGPPGEDERLAFIRRLRQERSQPVIRALEVWGQEVGRSVLPQCSLGKALQYMTGLWRGLTRFLDDPRVPLSSNAVERSLRGPVVGRKNFYGCKSKRGMEVASLFYTLLQSAKVCRIPPELYLREAAEAALRGEEPPLPHELAATLEPPPGGESRCRPDAAAAA